MCIYMYMYMYTHIYVCVCIYMYMYICTQVYKQTGVAKLDGAIDYLLTLLEGGVDKVLVFAHHIQVRKSPNVHAFRYF